MRLLELLLHEFFTFPYQLFFFLPILCHDTPWRKFGFWRLILLALAWCVPGSVYYAQKGEFLFNAPWFMLGDWYSVYYLLTTAYAVAALLISSRISLKAALFYATGAYIVEHLASNLYLLAALGLRVNYTDLRYQAGRFLLLLLLVAMFWLLIEPRIKKDVRENHMQSPQVVVLLVLAITLINVLTSRIYVWESGKLSDHPGYLFYGIFCSILLFVIQYGMLDLTQAVSDKKVMQEMIREMEKQYRLSRENVEALNAKYHDFKYRILELAGKADSESGRQYLKDSLSLIETYESSYQTGCEPLNVLLTEKGAACRQKGIDLSCLADGDALSFMEAGDVYLLFGNALDNAIEALTDYERGKRFISLTVVRKKRFILITVENPCRAVLEFEGGLPKTTKSDRLFHGFGTKSIQYITEKYGGNVTMQCDDGFFRVVCLLPDKTGKKNAES